MTEEGPKKTKREFLEDIGFGLAILSPFWGGAGITGARDIATKAEEMPENTVYKKFEISGNSLVVQYQEDPEVFQKNIYGGGQGAATTKDFLDAEIESANLSFYQEKEGELLETLDLEALEAKQGPSFEVEIPSGSGYWEVETVLKPDQEQSNDWDEVKAVVGSSLDYNGSYSFPEDPPWNLDVEEGWYVQEPEVGGGS